MASLAKVIKEEIQKSARKEAAALLRKRGTKDTDLRKTVASLKERITLLEQENKRMSRAIRDGTEVAPKREVLRPPKKDGRRRFTAKGIAGMRIRLKLTAGQFAKLTDVSIATVYNWEKSTGPIRLRGTTRTILEEVIGMGRKDALARLDSMGIPAVIKRGRRTNAEKEAEKAAGKAEPAKKSSAKDSSAKDSSAKKSTGKKRGRPAKKK